MRTDASLILLMGLGLVFALSSGAQPVITSQPMNQSAVDGGNATFTVVGSGGGPFTYRWLLNGTNLPFQNIITTVAGSSANSGFSGDGGLATNAMLTQPEGVAADQIGNIFISDSVNGRIRKVATNGIITTVAGNGLVGLSDDGGAATNTPLRFSIVAVSGIVVDDLGNLFIADTGNARVRKVDTNGIITSVAGIGSVGFSGDGGAATNSKLYLPEGICVDGLGNPFIADTSNRRIRKVDTNRVITTVAGTNAAGFTGDGGPANLAQLQQPMGVAVDRFGILFIADTGNYRIRKVDANGIITTIAGFSSGGYSGDGGSAVAARLNQPARAISDSFGNLYIADNYNNRIRKVDTNGIITTLAGTNMSGFSGDGGAAANASLNKPLDLALDAYGNLLIADSQNNRIRKVDLSGSPFLQLSSITTNSSGNYQVIITSLSGSVTRPSTSVIS